jgi:flagellar biosynthesis protein FlhB
MAESSAGERTEEATPRKRQQARKRGSVVKSVDLNGALIIGAMLIALPGLGSKMVGEMMASFKLGMTHIPTTMDQASMGRFVGEVAGGPLAAFGILMGIILGVGVFANLAQVGFLLAGENLKPQWQRIDPMQGFKRMFGKHAAMEGFKAVIKTALFGYLAYGAIQAHQNEILGLAWKDAAETGRVIGATMTTIGMRVGLAWLVLAGIDYFFQRKMFDKNLMMTKDEVKQEFKETEQSPEMRMAMMRARSRMKKGRLLDAVKSADLILTNPTHFSVALKYEPGKMHAPQVVAKGQDLVAFRIREIAKENGIPIVPNPPLARQIYKQCETGDFVPRELFQAVAEVLAFVYRTVRHMR